MKTYTASLIDTDNMYFDLIESNSLAHIKKWAKGRGGIYVLKIDAYWSQRVYIYRVVKNRLYKVI